MFALSIQFFTICSLTFGFIPKAEEKVYYEVENEEHTQQVFHDFILKYNRIYSSEEEKQVRYNNFKNNLLEINRLNLAHEHALYDINELADWSDEEFSTLSGIKVPDDFVASEELNFTISDMVVPEYFNWRDHGVVTKVKDQTIFCGSCWAFSTIGNIESQFAMKYGLLIDLSEQQLVDCDASNSGCRGGWLDKAMKYIEQVGGISSEDQYPYVSFEQTCKLQAEHRFPVRVVSHENINLGGVSEEHLKELLIRNGPISVMFNSSNLKFYKWGIIPECGNSRLHAILLIGYGVDDNIPYWILKNSWGEPWGENGYFRIYRGYDRCGMMNPYAASAKIA